MMEPTIKTDKYELYLGDCLDVLPHLEPVDLLLTDPPYGNNYHTGHRKGILRYSTKTTGDIIEKPILNDTLDDLVPLLKDVVEIAGGADER